MMAAPAGEPSPRVRGGRPARVPWRALVTVSGFSLAPFVHFLAVNRLEGLPLTAVAPYASLTMAVSIAIVLLAWWPRGTYMANRVAVALSAVLFTAFNYPGLTAPLSDARVRYQLLGWCIVLAAFTVGLWLLSRYQPVRVWMLLLAVLLAGLPMVEVVTFRTSTVGAAPAPQATSVGLTRTPDIYFIVPDAYARQDILMDGFDFDNSAFLLALQDRGFVIADKAYANYPTTFLSVAATLEMEYVVEPGPSALVRLEDGRGFDRSSFYGVIGGQSSLLATLRQAGYKHVQAPPGTWRGSACSGDEDLCIAPISDRGAAATIGEMEWALLQRTPFAALLAGLGETFDSVYSDPVHTAHEIERQQLGAPVFAFVHMMQSHPPYRFDGHCRRIEAGGRDLQGWAPEGMDAYIEGIKCTNRRLLAMLDVLPREAVIVIQSDHGPNYLGGVSAPVREWTEQQVEERMAVLSAIRLPEDCRDSVDDDLAGVNTFRIVLACLAGEQPHLLPNRRMLARYAGNPEVFEIP